MKVAFYVIANQNGAIRTTKGRPSVGQNEVPVHITLDLPSGLFTRPQLNAVITVADELPPVNITADVADNIASVVREQLGIVLTVQPALAEPAREGGVSSPLVSAEKETT